MLICPEASSAQNNIAAVSADGRTVWVLIRRLNSSCKRSIALVVRRLRHWLGGNRAKEKQAALEVVRKRLDKEQLSERFVMITDINSDRRTIVGSIREQVQALHARPTGGAPDWKRERERLAARIEFLENDLDRQQAALHQVDEPTGLRFDRPMEVRRAVCLIGDCDSRQG